MHPRWGLGPFCHISSSDEKINPCALFSHRLTLTEWNYNIRNRKLMAVKLTLEEWRHWLEGAGFPFIVWTEYICAAKIIHFRQARWALFSGLPFLIAQALRMVNLMRYRGSLRLRLVPPLLWPRSKVRDTLRDIYVPAGCPESLLFVPESVRTSVLQWGFSSSLACHPGATRTHRLIKQRFWWPSMVRDTRRFVSACPICAAIKGSNRPQQGYSSRCQCLRDPDHT